MPFKKISAKNSAPKIVLAGNFGAGNFGDELILAGFLRKISRELPKSKVVVLAAEPKLVRRFHGVDALPMVPTGFRSFAKMNWWRSVAAVKNCDAVIFPGGGLFADEENPRAVWIWGAPILLARYFWRPVFLLGQSVGPFGKNWTRKFTKFCLAKTEWIGARDAASENELRKIGVPAKKIRAGKDSALLLAPRLPKIREIKKRGVIRILISLRDFPGVDEKFWNEFARALDALAERKNARISFAEFGRGDAEIWRKIKRRAKNSAPWKILKLPESADGILREMKKIRPRRRDATALARRREIGRNARDRAELFAESREIRRENFAGEKFPRGEITRNFGLKIVQRFEFFKIKIFPNFTINFSFPKFI